MIASEHQLKITKQRLEEFKESLTKEIRSDINPILAKAAKAEIKYQIEILENEIAEFENLRRLGVEAIKINNERDIFLIPIKYRIAKNMTRNEFSALIKVSERQIIHYESDEYQNISSKTFMKILSKIPITLDSLGLKEKDSVNVR